MKLTSAPTIVFAIFLTIWVHVAVGRVENFSQLLEKLEEEMQLKPEKNYPFTKTDNVIEELKKTSDKYKAVCVAYYNLNYRELYKRDGSCALVTVHNVTLERFRFYSGNLKTAGVCIMLWEIHPVDPIGFLVDLNEKNADLSPDVSVHIKEFYKKMVGSKLYKVIDIASASSDGTELVCSICQESPEANTQEIWVAPKCGHALHQECALKWVDSCEELVTCPNCRSRVRN